MIACYETDIIKSFSPSLFVSTSRCFLSLPFINLVTILWKIIVCRVRHAKDNSGGIHDILFGFSFDETSFQL